MKHVLILGSTGFIGSALYKAFMRSAESNYHFHLLVREDKGAHSQKNTTVYTGKIEDFNWDDLTQVPDLIYHFARINSSKGQKWGRKWAAYKGKKANERMLGYFSAKQSPIQLIYLSGSLMYGNSNSIITENNLLKPISFAREYNRAEIPFIRHQKKTDSELRITLVRAPWVLGNGSWFKGFFINRMLSDKKSSVYGNGANKMSFITLTDLVSCLMRVPSLSFKTTLNVAYPEAISQLRFVEIISEITGFPIQKVNLSGFERAIQEAFKSNIQLGTIYTDFDEILLSTDVEAIIKSELRLLLENIQ